MGVAEVLKCKSCKKQIHEKNKTENEFCKHCYNKQKYGVSDINNCFKGSVITID